jgi:RNA polymerase sigma factor (TIGR02999 family)
MQMSAATSPTPPEPEGISAGSAPLASQPTEELLVRVYDQLRRLARQYMSHERADHTLQATALVHEAYVRVTGTRHVEFQNQAHFFHAAAEAMRRILIERGRQRQSLKAGGGPTGPRQRVPLTSVDLAVDMDGDEILALDDAISRLEKAAPDVAAVVRLRFYAGLGVEETAQVLGISPRSVNREWTYARAWLFRELGFAAT